MLLLGALQSLVTNYAVNQNWDVMWAADWNLPDEMHTRLDNRWVDIALMQGVYDSFEIGAFGYGFNPLDVFAGARYPKRTWDDSEGPPAGKKHGDLDAHFIPMVDIFNQWKAIPGVRHLKMNKALCGPDGRILKSKDGTTLRPDVQFWYRGKLYIAEIENTKSAAGKIQKYQRILQDNSLPTNIKKLNDW